MLIAIDYDLTYTRDPDYWDAVIALGVSRGHRFVCVTSRTQEPGAAKAERRPAPEIPYVLAGEELKADAARAAGLEVQIWIDDCPRAIG